MLTTDYKKITLVNRLYLVFKINIFTYNILNKSIKRINGAKRTRTADPLHAMQVLYQLSYGPKYLIWQWLQSISSNITIILHHSSIPNLRQILLNYALLIFYGEVFILYFITKTSQSSFWKNFADFPINFKGSFCFSWFQGLRH